eukprot:TRINITY_DN7139_c0_g1_i1.p1 TRINITY_DN7139_c0_g1~~TRINITY_DN7139_c0_g1_i1.p1  ORF type:complete len:337 (+),score=20.55 TRINITY_DN7139_c0_g1_i1:57-1067(+)
MSSAWRRAFVLVLMCGTFYWGTIVMDEWVRVTERETYRKLDTAEKHVLVASDLVHQMTKTDVSRAVLAETVFLNCFFFLVLTLMYHKRGGSTGYIAGAFFTNSCIGMGLCNYLFPITPLRAPTKPDGKKVSLPHVGHYLYTSLACITVALAWLRWSPQFCVYGLVGYLALPLVLVVLFPVSDRSSISNLKSQLCIVPWVVAGGFIALHSRSTRSFPVYDLQNKLFDSGLLQILLGRFYPNEINGHPVIYLAFASQLISLCFACLLFSLLDKHGRVSFFIRLLLVPFFFLAPTVAIPLYFMLRKYTDVEMVALEDEVKKPAPKGKKLPPPKRRVDGK